jgi:zinc protease
MATGEPPEGLSLIDKRLCARVNRLTATAALAALAILPSPAFARQAANPWGVPYTDVTPDPSIRFGQLANGMKYAIRRNATPKGTASVRLLFTFGGIAVSE